MAEEEASSFEFKLPQTLKTRALAMTHLALVREVRRLQRYLPGVDYGHRDPALARLLGVLLVALLPPNELDTLSREVDLCKLNELVKIGLQLLRSQTKELIDAALDCSAIDVVLSTKFFCSGQRVRDFYTKRGLENVAEMLPDSIFQSYSVDKQNKVVLEKPKDEEVRLLLQMITTSCFCRRLLVPVKPRKALSRMLALMDSLEHACLILADSPVTIFHGYHFTYADLRMKFRKLDRDLRRFLYYNLRQACPSSWDKNSRRAAVPLVAALKEMTPEEQRGLKLVKVAEVMPDAVYEHLRDELTEAELRILKLFPGAQLIDTSVSSAGEVAPDYMYDGREMLREARKREPRYKRRLWQVYLDSDKGQLTPLEIMNGLERMQEQKRSKHAERQKLDVPMAHSFSVSWRLRASRCRREASASNVGNSESGNQLDQEPSTKANVGNSGKQLDQHLSAES